MSKEIDDYIKEMVANNQGTREQILEQFSKSDDSDLVAYATNAAKPKVEETKKTMMEQFVTPHPMLGISPADVALYGGLAGAAVAGGRKAIDIGGNFASKGFQYAKDKLFEPSAVPPPTSVPTASTQDLMTKPNPLNVYAQEKFGIPLFELEQASGGPIKSITDLDIVGNTFSKGGGISVNPISGSVSNAPSGIPSGNPMNSLTNRPNPYMTPSVQAGVEAGNPTPAVQTVVAQELDKATDVTPSPEATTVKGPKKPPDVLTFKSAKDIPEGMMFRPDVGNLDRSLGNILGLEHRANAREMLTGGKPFGQFTGAGPKAYNDEISRLTTEYFQKLQSEIPETILSRDARRAQGIPSDFGTYAKTTNFGKAAKVGGVAGTLIAIADAANAAQRGNYGEAGFRGLDVATDMIPVVAQMKQGLSPTEVGAGSTLSAKQIQQRQNAYLLGSPYAQTEEAKKSRLKEKAGAGRGIAPPSAYMR